MSHGPSSEWGTDHASGFKTRLGGIMFVLYAIVYAGFIFINVARPDVMRMSVGSLNLASIYGFGLILVALVQAYFYNRVCTKVEDSVPPPSRMRRK